MGRILIGNIKGPQGAQGIQGPQGPVGATGPQGPMPDLINNALTTEAGVAALDAAMGKALQDQITKLNGEFIYTDISSNIILNTETINECRKMCHTNGVVATATIDGSFGSKPSVKDEVRVLATGLPPSVSEFQDLTIEIDNQETYIHNRAWVTNEGILFVIIAKNGYTGNVFVGGTYACKAN